MDNHVLVSEEWVASVPKSAADLADDVRQVVADRNYWMAEAERLSALVDEWEATGDVIMLCATGKPGPLSDSDVCGVIRELRADFDEVEDSRNSEGNQLVALGHDFDALRARHAALVEASMVAANYICGCGDWLPEYIRQPMLAALRDAGVDVVDEAKEAVDGGFGTVA